MHGDMLSLYKIPDGIWRYYKIGQPLPDAVFFEYINVKQK